MMKTSNPPWEDLPQELLLTIADFLTPNPVDVLTFRAICKSWNSSSPPFSPFNLSHILPLISSTLPLYKYDMRFYPSVSGRPIISVTAIFALHQKPFSNMVRDKQCWLMFVDQLTPGKLMIRQPLTKYHYRLPLNFPSGLDVPNIHVDEVGRFYNFSLHPEMNEPPSIWSEHVQKVVVNCDESRAFMLLYTGKVGCAEVMMDPRWGAGSWSPLSLFGFSNDSLVNDIIYYKTKLLGVDHVGKTFIQDFSSSAKKTIASPVTDSGSKRKRLVEANGLIYLVIRETSFKVFELDEDVDEWVEVNSVGDMVFFFGLEFSVSIPTQKLGGSFRKNCIVYAEQSFKDYDEGINDDDILFSHLSYGDLRVGVWHMDEDRDHCRTIGSYPGYSNVLWPPPTWLWSIDMSKRIRDLEAAINDLHMDQMDVPAENLKAVTNDDLPPVEKAIVVDDDAGQNDNSVRKVAHMAQIYLYEAKDIHQRLESMRPKNCQSINSQDQAGPSSCSGTEEWEGSVSSEADDVYTSIEMMLNGMLLNLEEITTKLQSTLKGC